VLLAANYRTQAQGAFQNLDFESAMPPFVSVGGGGFDFVAVSNALPAWTPYIGTNAAVAVLHNSLFLGTAVVGILGPGWTNGPTALEGSYSVILQAGANSSLTAVVPAAIAQSALIPVDAKSIQFKAAVFGALNTTGLLGVYIGGQSISIVPLLATGNYVLYGADISQFAGQVTELRIAALPTELAFGNAYLDSIELSSQAIPEPGTIALSGLALVACVTRLRKKLKRNHHHGQTKH